MAISEDIEIITRVEAYLVLSISLVVGLVFNIFISSINEGFNHFYKNSHKFYAKYNSLMSLRLKLKLLNAMERCGERRRLIGFWCGLQFVITRQIALKMFIIFLRFLLLSQKLLLK